MPLQSMMFRSSKRLQACLVQDQSHLTPGSKGDHVCRIQTALCLLGYDIAAEDLKSSLYGKSTAKAVLAYKKERNIINPSYQTQADDIVGKMTIAAMDKELYALDRTAMVYPSKSECLLCKNLTVEGADTQTAVA